jgi:hypothetical protein
MTFTDRMTSFTEQLKASIQERDEALVGIKHATEDVLKSAQGFVADVAAEHRAMGEALHANLTADHDARCDRVAEMRHEHRESLDHMRVEMQKTLDATRQAREAAVQQMRGTFAAARREVAGDLHGAAAAWRSFAAGR